MFQTKVVEKIKTHILGPVFFFLDNRAVYEIMWENIVKPDRPQMTVWRMRIACWITNVINIDSEYVMLIFSLLQQLLQERAPSVTLYVNCLSYIRLTSGKISEKYSIRPATLISA